VFAHVYGFTGFAGQAPGVTKRWPVWARGSGDTFFEGEQKKKKKKKKKKKNGVSATIGSRRHCYESKRKVQQNNSIATLCLAFHNRYVGSRGTDESSREHVDIRASPRPQLGPHFAQPVAESLLENPSDIMQHNTYVPFSIDGSEWPSIGSMFTLPVPGSAIAGKKTKKKMKIQQHRCQQHRNNGRHQLEINSYAMISKHKKKTKKKCA
jgi:hypothetical protein